MTCSGRVPLPTRCKNRSLVIRKRCAFRVLSRVNHSRERQSFLWADVFGGGAGWDSDRLRSLITFNRSEWFGSRRGGSTTRGDRERGVLPVADVTQSMVNGVMPLFLPSVVTTQLRYTGILWFTVDGEPEQECQIPLGSLHLQHNMGKW